MSIVTMNMSSFEIGRSDLMAYGDEVLCAEWNPALALKPCTESKKSMPADMLALDTEVFIKKMYDIEIDAEVFLQKMYTYQ